MAKSVGLVGAMSGKAGNLVFTNQSGTQVASVHRRERRESYTEAQLATRFRFTMARAISSVFPNWLLQGLGGNVMRRRAKFEKMLNKAVRVERTDDGFVACIDSASIILSEGSSRAYWSGVGQVLARYVTLERDGVRYDVPTLQIEYYNTVEDLNLYYVCLVVSGDGRDKPRLGVYHAKAYAAYDVISFSYNFWELSEPSPHERVAYFWVVPFVAPVMVNRRQDAGIESSADMETIEKEINALTKREFGRSWVPIDNI